MKQTDTQTNFDPEKFLVVAEKRFDDLKIGDIFRAPSRTLADAHAVAFQSVSADNHPVHYDSVWAARHGHSAPVVHGLQVLAFTAPGATLFPHYIGESFIAFIELSCSFLKEVHSGDTLYSALEIVNLVSIARFNPTAFRRSALSRRIPATMEEWPNTGKARTRCMT
jgi:acyl dehydratase